MTDKQRPTSPHLQIYRWNVSSLTSIMHRFSGVVLYFSFVAIAWYITYYAYQININDGHESCECTIMYIIRCSLYVVAVALCFALYYHLFNGVRHLFWDIGKGFDKQTSRTNGYLVIGLTLIASVVTLLIIYYLRFF